MRLIPIADIVYLKSGLKYVTVRTAEREYLLDETFAQLEQEFDADFFVRIHRSCRDARQEISGFQREPRLSEAPSLALL